ncbi:NAD-dependent epimerase/dehydratase family protein [Candidatus Woesearchaeota archaeon]|nr:NAD-dependent epimerase/dehydratase family protein [Candidatus Woesearchaeota archaeon]
MVFKHVLITGGCGFLGQHLTHQLLNEFPNLKIKIIDLKPNSLPLFQFPNNVEIVLNQNICDYDSIKHQFKNIDAVIHLAGIVSFSIKDKELMKNVNILGTRNVLKAALKNKIKLFIHISSVAALGYNNNQNKPINENFKFNWKIAKKRKKYYMLTKYLADIEVEKYKDQGLNTIVLYPGLMFGPGDAANSARLIKALKYRKIPFNMPGGTNVIDVRDVSNGIVTALKQKAQGYYLLSGYNLTMKQINQTIAQEFQVKPPKLTLPKFLNFILFHPLLFIEKKAKNKLELAADNLDSSFKFRYFDNSKAKKELNWQPQIDFRKTIKDSIVWLDQNGLLEK